MSGSPDLLAFGTLAFGKALLDAELPVPDGIIGPDGNEAPKRFGVYRNNVVVSLCDALANTFPAIKALVGEEYFSALARVFVTQHPPQSPVLIWYGAGFADFLAGFPPLADYPYLGDVARAEWAWLEAFHSADEAVLDPADLGAIEQDKLGQVRFAAHPATRIIVSDWPIWDLLRGSRFDPETEIKPDMSEGQAVLLVRPDVEVGVYLLRPGAAVFFKNMVQGQPLSEAAAAAQSANEAFSLSDCLSDALSSGAFSRISTNS